MNEEDLVTPGMMGSAVYCASQARGRPQRPRQGQITVETELKKFCRPSHIAAATLGAKPFAFLEAHISRPDPPERKKDDRCRHRHQGKRIPGQVDGEENHAGTSPRSARRRARLCRQYHRSVTGKDVGS